MKLLRKGYADQDLLNNPQFDKYSHMRQTREKLATAGITSYSKLIETIQNNDADPELRVAACWIISNIHEAFNEQHITAILLKLIKSSVENLQDAAAHSLSFFKGKRVARSLVEIACDKQQNRSVRIQVIQGLVTNKNIDAFNQLRSIIFDDTEGLDIRSQVIEWISYPPKFDETTEFIQLLQYPQPDIRFWAAYRFSQEHRNILEALPTLDRVAAFDHHLPESWGWQIGREALRALEGINWRALGLPRHWNHPPMYLISPAAEYMTFVEQYREFQGWENPYINRPMPPVEMKIQADWLEIQLRQQWPNIELNVRQPKPQTYVLDWKLKIGGAWVIGGLHRDQYGLVLAGNERAIYKFAAWYRSLINNEQALFLYEWADIAVELRANMTGKDVQAALYNLQKSRQLPCNP